jgi:hypothetical protein
MALDFLLGEISVANYLLFLFGITFLQFKQLDRRASSLCRTTLCSYNIWLQSGQA